MRFYKLLITLAIIYLVLFFIVWCVGMFGIWLTDGIQGIQDTLSPWNFANLIVTLVLASPGLLLYMLANKIKEKYENKIGSKPASSMRLPKFFNVDGTLIMFALDSKTGEVVSSTTSGHPYGIGKAMSEGTEISEEEFTRLSSASK